MLYLKHKHWERAVLEKDCQLRPIPWVLLPGLFWFINPSWAEEPLTSLLSACRSTASSLEVITHQGSFIPGTAGSAPAHGFRSKKPFGQLNSKNDPPLNTLKRSAGWGLCTRRIQGHWLTVLRGTQAAVSFAHWTAVKISLPPWRYLMCTQYLFRQWSECGLNWVKII